MPEDPKNIQSFGLFNYKIGGVISAKDIDSIKEQQEINHADINFSVGWLIIFTCLIGGVIVGINSKDVIAKTGGFALASSSLGAVIQRHASTRK